MTLILALAIIFFTLFSGGVLVKHLPDMKLGLLFFGSLMILTAFLYLYHGRPLLPDHPYHKIQQVSTSKEVLDTFDEIILQQELVRRAPKNDQAWFKLGHLYQKTKQYYKAALTYREAWKLNPNSYDYKLAYTQALLFFDNLHVSKATAKLLNELHKENPNDPHVIRFMKYVKGYDNVG